MTWRVEVMGVVGGPSMACQLLLAYKEFPKERTLDDVLESH